MHLVFSSGKNLSYDFFCEIGIFLITGNLNKTAIRHLPGGLLDAVTL